jgi:hypothetical protein
MGKNRYEDRPAYEIAAELDRKLRLAFERIGLSNAETDRANVPAEAPQRIGYDKAETPGRAQPVKPIGPLSRGRKFNPVAAANTRPWEALKISRSTYYRMKRIGLLNSAITP